MSIYRFEDYHRPDNSGKRICDEKTEGMVFTKMIMPLNGDRRLINVCRKAGLNVIEQRGEFNGYGYERLPLACEITTEQELERFLDVSKKCKEIRLEESEKKKVSWIKRLAKLAVTVCEKAAAIAAYLLDEKDKKIAELEASPLNNPVDQERELNRLMRSNPLKRIVDADQAKLIVDTHDFNKLIDQFRQVFGRIEYEDIVPAGFEMRNPDHDSSIGGASEEEMEGITSHFECLIKEFDEAKALLKQMKDSAVKVFNKADLRKHDVSKESFRFLVDMAEQEALPFV